MKHTYHTFFFGYINTNTYHKSDETLYCYHGFNDKVVILNNDEDMLTEYEKCILSYYGLIDIFSFDLDLGLWEYNYIYNKFIMKMSDDYKAFYDQVNKSHLYLSEYYSLILKGFDCWGIHEFIHKSIISNTFSEHEAKNILKSFISKGFFMPVTVTSKKEEKIKWTMKNRMIC